MPDPFSKKTGGRKRWEAVANGDQQKKEFQIKSRAERKKGLLLTWEKVGDDAFSWITVKPRQRTDPG